jgi:predicted PhzF superfamily epimerase YddE/YHI9
MLKFIQVNAFSRKPFAGSPIAVLWAPAGGLDAEEQERLARETGQAVTAFVEESGAGPVRVAYHLPWEPLDRCLEGALAVAHALWTEGRRGHGEAIVLETRDESLTIRKRADHLCMHTSALVPLEREQFTNEVAAIPGKCFVGGDERLRFVELESEELVKQFRPMATLPTRVMAVTAASAQSERDFVSRVFVQTPAGIREDAVHGEAHLVLFPYWRDKTDGRVLRAEQLSPRGGGLHAEWEGDQMILSGQAVTTFKGLFTVRP